MLAALHQPLDASAERLFLARERVRTGRLARIGAIAVTAIVSLNYLIGVTVFGDWKGWATCLAAAAATVVIVATTRAAVYLRKPALDIVVGAMMWTVILVDFFEEGFAHDIFRDYPHFSVLDATRIFNTCVIQLFLASVYSSVIFLGNYRTYLLYTLATVAAYETFIFFLLGVEPVIKILFLGLLVIAIALFFNRERENSYRDQFATNALLDRERIKTEDLLFNVLPETVANRLKSGDVVVDSHAHLTVVFVDVVGFSTLSKRISPEQLLDLLNRFFLEADHCAARYGLEKVKTIGDAYLAVAGGVSSATATGTDAIRFGRDLIAGVTGVGAAVAIPFDVRVGIHTGPAIGGVIGETRLAYDYWGETVNIAARIEGVAPVGGIAVSDATHAETAAAFAFDPPRAIELKGVGVTTVYPLRAA